MNKTKIKELAQCEAMGTIFSEIGDWTFSEVMNDPECLYHDDLVLHEDFEHMDIDNVREQLNGVAKQFERFGLMVAGK